jgi:hypothetical protein
LAKGDGIGAKHRVSPPRQGWQNIPPQGVGWRHGNGLQLGFARHKFGCDTVHIAFDFQE